MQIPRSISTSDPQLFDPGRLISQHQKGVWRYIRALGCDASMADDITQETFLAVMEKPFEDYNPAATAAYLRRVAYNLFISAQRRARRVTLVENVDEFDAVWVQWVGEDNGEDLLQKLNDCFQLLTARARHALELRFRHNERRVTIAANLGITDHGARNLLQRAKKQLRMCIEGKLP